MAQIAIGTLLALALVGAAAYAAGIHGGRGKEKLTPPGQRDEPAETVPPTIETQGSGALRIPGHPPAIATVPTARFRVEAPGEPALRCRLDKRPVRNCDETVLTYRGVGLGSHTFYVQALGRNRVIARSEFDWLVLEPKPFEVEPEPGGVGPLYPGETPTPIPVVITNPNQVPITITSLKVTASGGPAGCLPGANLALTTPALGNGRLRIAAHDSVSLPSATVPAPTIALRDLPFSQDACQNGSFNLAFSGSAGG